MGKNRRGKTLRVLPCCSSVVGIGDDNPRYLRLAPQRSKVVQWQRNWIDKIKAKTSQKSAGKKVRLDGRIVSLPDPNAGRNLMDFGIGHEGRVPGKKGLGKVVALQVL